MQQFMGEDFLLKTETAKHLFHTYAENLPIYDYHCHINPKEFWENMSTRTLPRSGYMGIIISGELCEL